MPSCGMVRADWRSRQAREAQPFANPISLLGHACSPAQPAQELPSPDPGFLPPPSSPESLLCPHSTLGSGCCHTCSEHTGEQRCAAGSPRHAPARYTGTVPPKPGLRAHLAGNGTPWRDGGQTGLFPPPTRCAGSNACALSCASSLRCPLLPSAHHEEPQHPRTPGAHAGTVSPIQQHPWLDSEGVPKRGPPTPSLAGAAGVAGVAGASCCKKKPKTKQLKERETGLRDAV